MTRGWLRTATVCAGTLLVLATGPGIAHADVVFDPADADELAAILAEAAEGQDICYGWRVQVYDPDAGSDLSVGTSFGAGSQVSDFGPPLCATTVEFFADITYTSESSEAEDSATYNVVSEPSGPTKQDLDELDIVDEGGLVGDDVDVVVFKAVAALPQLAADVGVARPIEATPETGVDPDAHLTDSPGSDFWRQVGTMLLWGLALLVAGIVFGGYVMRSAHLRPRDLWRRTPARTGSGPRRSTVDGKAKSKIRPSGRAKPKARPPGRSTRQPDQVTDVATDQHPSPEPRRDAGSEKE
ncbi:MAG TPA: hypothetical protein VIS06_14235 [Mycobacteriales bacterium]